jgi:hypothetical protein
MSWSKKNAYYPTDRRLSIPAAFPARRQTTEEKIIMKAIVVTDQAAGPAGMKLVERPEPPAAHRRSSATSWPEWSPLSATARRDCR